MTTSLRKRGAGFTLIEIIAVIVIMSIIASLLVVAAAGARKKATLDAAKADVEYITNQIDAFFDKRGEMPPDTNGDGFVTEREIYTTLAEWDFPVAEERWLDPWGNPYIIVLGRDYGVDFPVATGGAGYTTPPFDEVLGMYVPTPAAAAPKEVHDIDPSNVASEPYRNETNGFQVISAGPDGFLSRNNLEFDTDIDGDGQTVNGDNITNW